MSLLEINVYSPIHVLLSLSFKLGPRQTVLKSSSHNKTPRESPTLMAVLTGGACWVSNNNNDNDTHFYWGSAIHQTLYIHHIVYRTQPSKVSVTHLSLQMKKSRLNNLNGLPLVTQMVSAWMRLWNQVCLRRLCCLSEKALIFPVFSSKAKLLTLLGGLVFLRPILDPQSLTYLLLCTQSSVFF